jgi:aspartyl-tRNA(Asn)/glutamyl-tRNA(Gln) amidotransferase subunit B
MEEGSIRCDANISVRKKGDTKLGTKVEVKNLNSIRNVKRAIDVEAERLVDIFENGGIIQQQTRSYDAGNNTTFAIRDKEDADDYRYFPEPDLAPFHLQDDFIDQIKKSLPALPEERIRHYTTALQLPAYDAAVLTEEKSVADYFEAVTNHTTNYKAAANWILGPVKTWMNENVKEVTDFPVAPSQLAAVIKLVDDNKVSFSLASTKLLSGLINEPAKNPEQLATVLNLLQQSDAGAIEPVVDAVLEKLAAKVQEYKKGKKGLLALFVGEVMKQTKGKADPKLTNDLILEKLKS